MPHPADGAGGRTGGTGERSRRCSLYTREDGERGEADAACERAGVPLAPLGVRPTGGGRGGLGVWREGRGRLWRTAGWAAVTQGEVSAEGAPPDDPRCLTRNPPGGTDQGPRSEVERPLFREAGQGKAGDPRLAPSLQGTGSSGPGRVPLRISSPPPPCRPPAGFAEGHDDLHEDHLPP